MYNQKFNLSIFTKCIAIAIVASHANASADIDRHENMTVTATKQALSITKVDGSIMVKTGEELEKAGITEVKDLIKAFPGVLIHTRGNRTYASTTIRGMNSPDFYSPSINIYVDGIKQDSAFLTQQLLNVERVELLRGSQGAIYGSNAQGGVINIITHKGDETTLAANVNYSNRSQQIGTTLSTHISDNIYADLVLRGVHEDGYIKHLPTNTKDANDTDTKSGMARLHYLPTDSPVSATLSLAIDDLNSHEEWYLSQQEFDSRTTSKDIPELSRHVNTYAFNLNYKFGVHTLSSVTSFQDREIDRTFIGGTWQENQTTLSEELRLQSVYSQNLSSTVGIYAESRDFDGTVNGAPNAVNNTSYALFGQALYALNHELDLTVGLRASQVKSSSKYTGNTWTYDVSDSDLLFSPKLALGWQINMDSRVYISASSGYRPGGFNHAPISSNDQYGYNPEHSLNTEIGWKTSLLDNSISINGALYWIETQDIQLYLGDPGSRALRNLGDARSTGLELEIAYYPTDDLTLTFGGTFGNSEFKDDNLDVATGNNLAGNTLPNAPEKTLIAGLEYFIPQSWMGGELSLIANARYNSKMYFDETNTLSQDGYTLLDLAVQYDFNSFVSLRLYGNNITNEEYKTYSFEMGPSVMSNYGDLQEFGINLKVKW